MRARKLSHERPDPGEFFALGTVLLDDLADPPTFDALALKADRVFDCNQPGARAALLTAVAARRVWIKRLHDEVREIYVEWALAREGAGFRVHPPATSSLAARRLLSP